MRNINHFPYQMHKIKGFYVSSGEKTNNVYRIFHKYYKEIVQEKQPRFLLL